MSVLVADLEVFEAIYSKIFTYHFKNEVTIDFCSSLSMTDNNCKLFVKELLTLSELSWLARYREEGKPNLVDFLNLRNQKPISTLQLLKYLEMIDYNIEVDTITKGYDHSHRLSDDDLKSFNLRFTNVLKRLNEAISELKTRVINHYTNIEDLPYCSL